MELIHGGFHGIPDWAGIPTREFLHVLALLQSSFKRFRAIACITRTHLSYNDIAHVLQNTKKENRLRLAN